MNRRTGEFYSGRRVLVTGGLGFLGSNLALALWRAGAAVTVVDSMVGGCGANERNLAEAGGAVVLRKDDIGDQAAMARVLPGQDVVFNLAGEISHTRSMSWPERDLDLNARAHLRFLECCRRHAPSSRIVYAGSRQIYGPPDYLPVDERHPVRPADFNGVHKWAAESYHRLLSLVYGVETVSLRLTNIYGPRQALNLPWQGFIGRFIALALRSQPIPVYGDGRQLRDMLFVDDAVEALLLAGSAPLPSDVSHAAFNLGGPEPLPLSRIAELVTEAAGSPAPVRYVDFPAGRKKIDIGSYYADDRAFRAWTGWSPQIRFTDGIRRTLDFYRSRSADYPLEPLDPAH